MGVRCGRMDQTIAAHAQRGSALLFETATGTIQPVPFPGRLWIVETGVSHRLTGGSLNQRRKECEEALAFCREWRQGSSIWRSSCPADLPEVERRLPPPLVPRVRHVVTETARTRAAARHSPPAICVGSAVCWWRATSRFGMDYESTIPEADLIVDSAVEHGAYGARLTGAGWGGAVVVLAPAEREARIVADIVGRFSEAIWADAGHLEHARVGRCAAGSDPALRRYIS